MAKYKIYGTVTGSKYLGEVEAKSINEAKHKGWKLDECYVSFCHQCSGEIEDPEIHDLYVEKV